MPEHAAGALPVIPVDPLPELLILLPRSGDVGRIKVYYGYLKNLNTDTMRRIKLIILIFALALPACNSGHQKEQSTDFSSFFRVQTGKPVTLVLACYKTTLRAGHGEETRVRVSVADSLDREITDAELPFRISVTGDANLLDAGRNEITPISRADTLTVWEASLNRGVCEFVLIAGNTPGKFKIEASTEGLWPASHEIHLLPAGFQLMQPAVLPLPPSPHIRPPMIGADISFLPQLEDEGMKFYDNGVETDAIELLRSHGFNYIRLRIFVNPEHEKGYSPGKGYCGYDQTLAMARRVKAAGLNLLLDFHYSDYWADPQQQYKPSAWEGQDFENLTASLRKYTATVLSGLKAQGTLPQMVQVGNEINHGIVWPEGHIGNPDQLASLLKAGVAACREADPMMPVMMHLALGGQTEEAVFWFDNMLARGVDFDIIGLSYYPRWHGTPEDLSRTMHTLAERFGKDINVAEYSAFKKEIHDLVFSLPGGRGQGACIWEPLNTWRRLFDDKGNALDEIRIYDSLAARYLR